MLKSDKIIFLIATAEKMMPMIPKITAATGIDINPALLPCEFDAMATMTIDETTVAIVDFFIIPTYSGRSPIGANLNKKCTKIGILDRK